MVEQTDVIDTNEIKRRTVVGVASLTSRTLILQIISLIGTFILTVILDPRAYGIFAVVAASINFLNYFSDIGLAAALVQKKSEPTRTDLVSTFTVQQLLVGFTVVITLLLSGSIANIYGLDAEGLWVLRALAIAFMLSSLKTIPSVLLERKLLFHKLILPQIVETLSFYTVAIILAIKGFGVASYAWAALVRGTTGTFVLYLTAPWMPGFGLNKVNIKNLMSFGIPYQANSFVALIKDDLLIVILGKTLGFETVGYFVWAKKWSDSTLRLFMDSIVRVTFPAFSRLQHDLSLLGRAIQKSLSFIALASFPVAIGMTLMIRPFIYTVPNYTKWEPALIMFYFLTFASVLASLSGPLFNALLALGRVKITFTLMIMWTVLTYIFVPIGVFLFGTNGLGVAMAVIGLSSFLPAYFLQKIVSFTLLSSVVKPLMATLGMVGSILIVFILTKSPSIQLLVGTIVGGATYLGLIYILMGQEVVSYLDLIRKSTSSGVASKS